MANRNTLWASIFVDELARSGLTAVCAAPGSRHTPLMLAFAKHESIKVYSHLDERSASFFALGMALASAEPIALVCTSGTAGANMYPAIIEAHQSRVPLIVVTADRPHELRHSGANQTIDQIKMFGDFALWFVDTALPEAQPSALAIRNLRTTANRAYATANGLRKGVVHINMPFRKPLEPTEVEGDIVKLDNSAQARGTETPFTEIMFGESTFDGDRSRPLVKVLNEAQSGMVICGPNCPVDTINSIIDFADIAHFRVFVDPTVPTPRRDEQWMPIVAGYETFLQNIEIVPPDLLIQFGDIPIGKQIQAFLNNAHIENWIQVSADATWHEAHHLCTHFVATDPYRFSMEINQSTKYWIEGGGDRASRGEWTRIIDQIEKTTWQTIDHEIETGSYFDGAVVYDVVELIPDESTLFAGNSLPVRHLDQFGKPQAKRIYTYANRGASGIDGNISSALGAGAARPDKPVVAIIGDITFYHDMNGLLAVHRCGVPITIVLLNNDGGGIFNRLPIRDYDPEFTEYFITPHGLDFSHAAALYSLDHIRIDVDANDARQQFQQAFAERVGSQKSTIIEVRSNSQRDEQRRQEIVAAVGARLRELNL